MHCRRKRDNDNLTVREVAKVGNEVNSRRVPGEPALFADVRFCDTDLSDAFMKTRVGQTLDIYLSDVSQTCDANIDP
jgi:hypothetical protein